jgi:hypothetical protein
LFVETVPVVKTFVILSIAKDLLGSKSLRSAGRRRSFVPQDDKAFFGIKKTPNTTKATL